VNYQDWLPLFGLPANDPRVVQALAAHGIHQPVEFGDPTESTTGVVFREHGLFVNFTSAFRLNGGSADLPILMEVGMKTIPGKSAKKWTAYAGPMPFGLTIGTSKDEALKLLGAPLVLSEDYVSGRWLVDGYDLGVGFTDDWAKINQLGLSLPESI
jgi:hypothetical protein